MLLAAACACDDRQRRAHEDLRHAGLGFSVESFLAVAASGDRESLAHFLDAGMHPDAADVAGETALLRAASRGQAHVVSLLLERGADAGAERPNGGTALLLAAMSGDRATVQALLEAGADPERADHSGATPLVAAAAAGSAECAALLVDRSPASGSLAMAVAAENGHTAVIDVLLNAGIDPDAVCAGGRIPLVAAAAAGQTEAVKLLVRRGAAAIGEACEAAEAAGHRLIAGWLASADRRPVVASEPVRALPVPPAVSVVTIPVAHRPVDATDSGAPEEVGGLPGLAGVRRPEWRINAMEELPEVIEFAGSVPEKYPFVLEEVARGHKSAVLALAGSPARQVTVGAGDAVPGTDLVVESMRRRMLYANGRSGDLVDASTIALRRERDGKLFTVPVKKEVFSGERTVVVRFAATGEEFAAGRGDEFRIGGLLLRVTEAAESGIRIGNRLTGESVLLRARETPP